MTVYYIKLKTGENLLGLYDPEEDSANASPEVFVRDIISFTPTPGSATTAAKFWITFSDQHSVNINLNDVYFFGLAHEDAHDFYDRFVTAVAEIEEAQEEEAVANIDGMTDDDIEAYFDPNKVVH